MTHEDQLDLEVFTHIDGFVLTDMDKLARVVHGKMGRMGDLVGGLGLEAKPKDVLAAYDRIAGLIKKDGYKIKTGSFWNFTRGVNAAHKEPKVKYLFQIEGETIEVDDPTELAAAITKTREIVAEKKEEVQKKMAKARAKSIVKGKPGDELETE